MRLSEQEFGALAGLMRLRLPASASSRALQRVLVQGETVPNAAMVERIQESHIETLLDSAKLCLERAKVVAGINWP